ncbi:TPA: hypothetical protein ACH3X2_001414 [Trebouxia sp. C0005]
MSTVMTKVLRADAAGPAVQRFSEMAIIGSAGLLPASLIAPDGSALQKASDTALGIALCLHSHIHINSVLSDYVPKSVLGATRIGALGVTGIAILGLTKLNLAGPGLTPTVKKLWTAPPAQ